MFHGKTAWFSTSVLSKRVQLWKQHDGKVVPLSKAQFVFSDDCQSPDTKKLYESQAYLNEHLAIFHSSYIVESVDQEDMNSVVLGDYFLPPLQVMEVIRGQVNLAWEKHVDHSAENSGDSGQAVLVSSSTESLASSYSDPAKRKRMLESLQGADLHSECQSSTSSTLILPSPDTSHSSIGNQAAKTRRGTAVQRRSPRKRHPVPDPEHDDKRADAGVVHINNLPKVSGIIEKFYPGEHGCEVYMKTSR